MVIQSKTSEKALMISCLSIGHAFGIFFLVRVGNRIIIEVSGINCIEYDMPSKTQAEIQRDKDQKLLKLRPFSFFIPFFVV